MEKSEPKRNRLKRLKRGIRIRTILFLALALTGNSFAWFVYSTRVSNSIQAHVKAWKVVFTDETEQITEQVNFSVDSIYPGMLTYTDSITIQNEGEAAANIRYELESIRIFDDVYEAGVNGYTSDSLIRKLNTEYPFNVVFSVSNLELAAGDGSSSFILTVNWPFESGNDSADTYWGNQSYNFMANNADENGELTRPEIELRAKIYATQAAQETEPEIITPEAGV